MPEDVVSGEETQTHASLRARARKQLMPGECPAGLCKGLVTRCVCTYLQSGSIYSRASHYKVTGSK